MTDTGTASTRTDEPNTLVNAVVGGLVSVLLSFAPFAAPVVGGAVAGYLQGPDRNAGVRVGAYAGLVAAIPLVGVLLVGVSLFSVVPMMGTGMMGPRAGFGFGLGLAGLLFVLVLSALYSVGLSALGGYLGAYVNGEA